jgi:hypothetical protein
MTRRQTLALFGVAILDWLLDGTPVKAAHKTPSEWTPEVIQLAKDTEKKYNLPHGICHAMNLQENSGHLKPRTAVPRAEKGYFNFGERHYQEIVDKADAFFRAHPLYVSILPFDMERFQQATSWGPWQLMGFNLRALGCQIPFLANLTLEEHFDLWGRFMQEKWIQSGRNLYKALRLYNGPKMPMSYYDHVAANMKKFSY